MKNVKSLVIIMAFLFAFAFVGNVAFADAEPAPADDKKVVEKTDTEKVVDKAKEGVKDVAEGAKAAKDAVKKGEPMGTFVVVIIVFVIAVIILLVIFALCGKKKKPEKKVDEKKKKK